jgi:uncharacterized protein YbjT (DUF2867 family)
MKVILLTGATGFVGQRLYPALIEAGYTVRCTSRDPVRAADKHPDRTWVRLDVDEVDSIVQALQGVDGVIYLVHGLASGPGYEERERTAARAFAEQSDLAGVQRIVYLGGVEPVGVPSVHLQSRLATGRILRAGPVPTIELRAGMIIGHGSESWQICRDLAVRLPLMLLPKWLDTPSEPVAVDDVVAACVHAIGSGIDSGAYDIPGPEQLSAKDILLRVARLRGNATRTLRVPVLTPHLSSYWLKLVTGADFQVAQQLVEGLRTALISSGPRYWDFMEDFSVTPFDTAAQRALDAGKPSSRRVRALEKALGQLARKHS